MRRFFLGLLFSVMPFSIAGGTFAGGILVLTTLTLLFLKVDKWQHNALVYGASLLILGGVLTGFIKGGLTGEDTFLRELYRLLFLFAVFLAFQKNPTDVYFKLFAFFAAFHAAFGTYQFFTGSQAFFSSASPYNILNSDQYFHAIGIFSHHQTFGGVMMMAFPVLLAPVLESGYSKKWKLFFLAAALCVFSGILFSFTRSAWLGSIVALGVLGVNHRLKYIKWLGYLIFSGIFISTLFFALYSEPPRKIETDKKIEITGFAEGFSKRLQSFNPYNNEERLNMWLAGLRTLDGNYLLGIGTGDISRLEENYLRIEEESQGSFSFHRLPSEGVHNIYLQIWLDAGFIGLVGYLAIFLGYFVSFYFAKKRKKFRDFRHVSFLKGITASVAAFAVWGFFENNFYDGEPQTVFLVLLGSALAMIHMIRRIKKERL